MVVIVVIMVILVVVMICMYMAMNKILLLNNVCLLFCFFVCLFFIHRFKTHIEFKTVDDTDDYVEPA